MGPFRAITLSRADADILQAVTKTITTANFNRYQRFMDVDPNTWNLVKCNDQMKIYAERRWKRRHSSAHNSSADDSASDLQSMLCIGSTSGTVDDVMAGIVDPSFRPSQTKTLFPSDLSGAVTLATAENPTPKDPFKSMSVKWLELDVRRRSMGFIKNRDYVYVEATGVEYIPRMGQVGFHLMHSVDIPEAKALPGRIRGKLSVCFFFRQEEEEDSVSIYVMWMMNSMNDQARRVIIPHFAQMLLSSFRGAQDSRLKKLAQTFGKGYSGLNNFKLHVATPYFTCVTCSKRVWGVGKLTSHDNDNTCELCLGYVCSTCKIGKKPKFFISSLDESKKNLTFCFACLSGVMTSEASKRSTKNSNNSNGLARRVCRSVRSLKSPGWSMRNTETSTSFASTS
ncbi:hypothetical protein PR001_g7126 [Phytophthora rubi]|uniref:START domain-containing protein n=2 Tax=Phytophthora rubi TaxID=129364 RepID=A0A6A3NH46_9STRA|nr:hypothetical protein PR001_g7126 [Phytophthora rubi]